MQNRFLSLCLSNALCVFCVSCATDTPADVADGAMGGDGASAGDAAAAGDASPGRDGAMDGGGPTDGSAADGDAAPPHPLVGSWTGHPADCETMSPKTDIFTSVAFELDSVEFEQWFSNPSGRCSTRGRGEVVALGDRSFELHNYDTIETNCSYGLFLAREVYDVAFEFLGSDRSTVFLRPEGSECYHLTRE